MTKPLTNFAASVRARLLNEAKRRKSDFQLTLQRYTAERFLYRLGVSPHRDQFVLKGAMLFALWDQISARSTRDLDLAGYWANDAESLAKTFREICSIPYAQDGLEYALDTLEIAPIRFGEAYHGFRIQMDVRLAGAVIPFQVDIGFGDEIVPVPEDVIYPTLLDGDAPHIRAYPREAVIAEKLHAMVLHADLNSRYKDFFDIYALSTRYRFLGETLTSAIRATFTRRKSATYSPWPVALTTGFYADTTRSDQWLRYLKRSKLGEAAPADFAIVGERMLAFLDPPLRAIADGLAFVATWPQGGPWR